MRWEHLTGGTFEDAVRQAEGVCVVPVGVIEYHGAHLPLGQDSLAVHALACRAAEREPVVVYPHYQYSVNTEAKHYPGTIVIKDRLIYDLLENLCDEISRNGLKKIVLLSGHGGNRNFLPYFTQMLLDKGKDYIAYYISRVDVDPELVKRTLEVREGGHADEGETSVALANHPDLVRMDLLDKERRWEPRRRMSHLPGIYTPADWFANWPEHCAGDARRATAEKGRVLFEAAVEALARTLKAVKADRAGQQVYAEFNSRVYDK